MENNLSDVFEQARQLVAEADRRVAETERRRREIEGQAKLAELVVRAEEAFDFTSREKLELDPRMDVHEDMAVIEFVVRSARAIFVLSPKDDVMWDLLVVEDGKNVSSVAEIIGGIKSEPNSRRLAAARVVASIATWVEKYRNTRRAPQQGLNAGQNQAAVQPPLPAQTASSQSAQASAYPQFAPVMDAEPAAASASQPTQSPSAPPNYETRERRNADAASRYDDLLPARIPASPPASRPAQSNPAPARSNYGTFGKFFGH